MGDSFCSGTTFTPSATSSYTDSYVTGDRLSCLPNGGTGFSSGDVNSKGIVSTTVVNSHVTTLLQRADAVPISAPADSVNPNTNPASNFAVKANALRTAIQSEYCFYYTRYNYLLTQLLTLAVTDGTNFAAAPYTTYKSNVIRLNSLLNQILQVMQGIVNSRSDALDTYYSSTSGVNSLNTELDVARSSLVSHMGKLQDSDMEQNVKTSMVEYTLEKNKSSRNLLAIYGFMNIVAVGMLVYLYRSSK